MFMVSEEIRIGLVTEHLPIEKIAPSITRENLNGKLQIMEDSLKKDFGIKKPKIAVLGLNPHAGDQGLIGNQETELILPLIQEKKNAGKLIFGPFPADGFFGSGQYAKFDGILAQYHDQGLIPFKLLSFEKGVNFTAGLPVVRTSPDHGTGYSLVGKGTANENSFRQALYQAADIIKNRREN